MPIDTRKKLRTHVALGGILCRWNGLTISFLISFTYNEIHKDFQKEKKNNDFLGETELWSSRLVLIQKKVRG